MKLKKLTVFIASLALLACGGSESGGGPAEGDNTPPIAQGFFLDAAVYGLDYTSLSYIGRTGYNGEFNFEPGEVTTFSYYGLEIGSILMSTARSAITPLDLFNTNDVNHRSVVNTLVFLQSFDNDQDPDNGIVLPLEAQGGNTGFSGFGTLLITDADFIPDLATPAASFNGGVSLVSEQAAITHFQQTADDLKAAFNLIGIWHMRSGGYGDISAVYQFNDDMSVDVTEFEECPDQLWAATASSAARNCTELTLKQTWTLTGRSLALSNEELSDKCEILGVTRFQIEASCDFQGSGLGNELVRFERHIVKLNDALISERYREVSLDTLSYTESVFDPDKSGSYVYYEGGSAQSGPGDRGGFTWSSSESQLSVAGTDNANESFAGVWSLNSALRGALITSFEGESSALMPDFQVSRAAGVITQSVYGVYDGLAGNCQNIYVFSEDRLRKDDSVQGSQICDYGTSVTLPEEGDAGIYRVSQQLGAFVIEQGDAREICWPYAQSQDVNGGGNTYLLCSNETSPSHYFQIWRGL